MRVGYMCLYAASAPIHDTVYSIQFLVLYRRSDTRTVCFKIYLELHVANVSNFGKSPVANSRPCTLLGYHTF